MIQNLLYEKNNYLTLLFWVALGVFTGPLVYAAVPLHMIIIKKKGEWLWLLLGFWLILTLSDSRQGMFSFAQSLKPIMLLIMAYLYITFPKEREEFKFVRPFIPFFIVAFLVIFNSPVQASAFQRTISYLLLLIIIPGIINLLLTYERERFLYHLLLTGVVILGTGLALQIIMPGFVTFGGERFSGLLGNPNAIGIFGFLFTALFTIINQYHSHLFSKKETIVIYSILAISLIFAGSRGGIFSALLFVVGWFLLKHNAVIGFIALALIIISYQAVSANVVNIIVSLGLEEYFRLETFETGSGRIAARDFGWQHIQQQYWWGKGFGYTEYLFSRNQGYFTQLGHQGNLHNSFLTIWLDMGLAGLVAFCFGWLVNFIKGIRISPLLWALMFSLILSASVESWMAASLNPFTIMLVIILSLMSNPRFYPEINQNQEEMQNQ
ncbi:O-antigen ligase family protein [Marinilabiliaceae bacterium ANBcel2]|nr:O-antigen ligase family protein [Marinilabiliaceae bacterium ANBcel2]